MAKKDKEDKKKDKKNKERMAGDRMMPEGGTKDLRGGRDGKYFYNKKGELKKRTENNNPFDVESLDDFDLRAAGSGSYRGIERLGSGELRSLRDEGRSREEIMEYAAGLDEGKVGDRAQEVLATWTDKIKQGKNPKNDQPLPIEDEVIPEPPADSDPVNKEINKIINNGDGNANVIGDGTAIGGNNKTVIDDSFTFKGNDITIKGNNSGNIGSQVTTYGTPGGDSRFSGGGAEVGTSAAYSGLDFSGVPNLREENEKRLKDINRRTQYLSDKGTLGLINLYGSSAIPLHWKIPSSDG